MSLLTSLEGVLDDHADDWLHVALDSAEELAAEHASGPIESALVGKALDVVRENEDRLSRLGAGGLVSVLTRVGFGRLDDARLTYLASGAATVSELVDASHTSTARTAAETQERMNDWEALKDDLVSIGTVALKIIPLLLMAA